MEILTGSPLHLSLKYKISHKIYVTKLFHVMISLLRTNFTHDLFLKITQVLLKNSKPYVVSLWKFWGWKCKLWHFYVCQLKSIRLLFLSLPHEQLFSKLPLTLYRKTKHVQALHPNIFMTIFLFQIQRLCLSKYENKCNLLT